MNHVFEKRYELITYPEGSGWAEGWGGFAARILVNPSGAELRHETKLFVEYQKGGAADEDAYWQYVAPRIPEWNLVIRDADGNEQEIPPPAAEYESVYQLEPSVIAWLALTIHAAHKGPKVLAAMQGIRTVSPTEPTTTDTTPPTNLSLLNSPPPAASSSTG